MEIAVVSGKGGTGKSSISSAFISIAKNVIAIDCDVDAANLYLLFNPVVEEECEFSSGKYAIIDPEKCAACGICQEACMFDAVHEKDGVYQIDPISCEGCALCSRLCVSEAIHMEPSEAGRLYACQFRYGKMLYGRLAPGEDNSGKFVNALRDACVELKKKAETNTIILDGPPGIGCPVMSTLTGVDKVVIVTEPTLSGLSDLKRISTVAKSFTSDVYVIINKADLNTEMTQEIRAYCKGSNTNVITELPFDKRMVEAMVNGQTIIEYAPDSSIAQQLEKAYAQIVNN